MQVSDIFQFHTRGIMEVHTAEGGAPPPFSSAHNVQPNLLISIFKYISLSLCMYQILTLYDE